MRWISRHFYPLEMPDVFLVRALKPFLETYVWSQKGRRAFFVRMDDAKGRAELRVRIKGEPDWLAETLEPAIEGWFAGRGECQTAVYEPEVERCGGETGLAWAEEYFHLSSRVALERMSRVPFLYLDAMTDALRMNLSAAFAAGLDRRQTAGYFRRLRDQWIELFFGPGAQSDNPAWKQEILEAFDEACSRQKEDLMALLDGIWYDLEKNKTDPKQPEWLRWLRGNQLILPEMDKPLLEKSLPSLLHLNHNRLGVSNQDEVYLAHVLHRAL